MDRRTARMNRTGLAIVGVILLLAGLAALARGLGLFGSADAAVTDPDTREFASDSPWFWWVVAAVAIVVALLALLWLASQIPGRGVRALRMEPDPRHGTTTVPARVAARALESDLLDSPHFRQASATLAGSPTRPRLHLVATLAPTADYQAARRRLGEALNRHRQALDTRDLHATVLLR